MNPELERILNSIRFYDCDWATIYATGPIGQIDDHIESHPELLQYFFDNIDTFHGGVRTNMYNYLQFSKKIEIAHQWIEPLKAQVENYRDATESDALLTLLEAINLESGTDISWLADMNVRPTWLKEYANKIAKQ